MKREGNVIRLVTQQETFGSNNKIHRNICKYLLWSNNREYNCKWKKKLNSSFRYDGQMYMNHFSQYFQGCFNHEGEPHFMETHIEETNRVNGIGRSREVNWRIKHTLLYENNHTELNDAEGLKKGRYRKYLYALSSTSYLIEYHLKLTEWTLLQHFYLGLTHHTHMNYETPLERFVVKSKKYPKHPNRDLVMYFVIFTTAPMQFQALLPINESIFGSVQDAFVINNMVIVYSGKVYCIYDLNAILATSTTEHWKIGDPYPDPESRNRVGEYPCALPWNVRIEACPVALFQLDSCKDIRGFTFGGYPWYCLASFCGHSQLVDLRTRVKMATLRHDKYSDITLDDEKKAYFHSDCSGRLLSVEYDQIKCLKIVEDSKKMNVEFQACYTINYSNPSQHSQANENNNRPRHSRSGRAYKRVVIPQEQTLPSEIVHSLDYDRELDLLVVLFTRYTQSTSEPNKYVVSLYDNQTGQQIRSIVLPPSVSDSDAYDWSVFFDDMLLVCSLGEIGQNRQTNTVFIYVLQEANVNS